MHVFRFTLVALLSFALAGVGPAFAGQSDTTVTRSDVQQIQADIDRASRDISDLRRSDSSLASRLDSELSDLSDEAIYLKVKINKGEIVTRRELDNLRDRVADLRSRANRDLSSPSDRSSRDRYPDRPPSSDPESRRSDPQGSAGRVYSDTPGVLPAGTNIDVRLEDPLNSGTARPEDRFTATTVVDLRQGDRLLVPAGSVMRGIVQSVDKATRTDRKGSLTVTFDRLTVNRTSYPMRGTVTDALESEGIRGEAAKIGAGAGVGAILGGILGGVKGAIAGILIGGGGTVAATEGTDVDLKPGTVLRVRLDSDLDLR